MCRQLRVFCLVLVFGLFILPNIGLSQGEGITLRPATIEEMMNPGEEQQFSFTIRNESPTDQTYYLGTRDIIGVRDGNIPVYADEGQEKTEFELSEWITLGTESVFVAAGQEVSAQFSVKAPDNASPGSHFAGIFITVEAPEIRESGAAIGYEVANIVSIRIAGDADERAEIRQFSTDNYIYGSPNVTFNVRIENSGNTLVRPRGPMSITNMFGTEVSGGLIFNESGGGVFPGDTREFTLLWQGEGPGFGRYEAIVSPIYGAEGANKTITSSVTFWILPMNIIGPALGILAFLFLVIWVGTKLYVRRKLAYYTATTGGRKLVRRDSDPGAPILMMFLVMLSVTAVFFIILLLLFS